MEMDYTRLGEDALRLAGMAARELERQLAEDGDVKKARDLSAILKDMTGLAQQLNAGGAQEITVVFSGDAAEAAV